MSATITAQRPVSFARLRAYLWLVRLGMMERLAYRFSSFLKLLDFPILVAVYYFVFQALYASLPEGQTTVGGMTLNQMITYVALAWSIDALISNDLDMLVGQETRDGRLAVYLSRPLSLIGFYAFQAMGHLAFQIASLSVPLTLAFAFVFPFEVPVSVAHGCLFLLSLGVAAMLNVFINFLVGLSALFFEFNNGLVVWKIAMQRGFGGLVIPLSLMPPEMRTPILWTPFPYLYYAPAQVYLSTGPLAEPLRLVATQALWVLALYLLSVALERVARRYVEIQGG